MLCFMLETLMKIPFGILNPFVLLLQILKRHYCCCQIPESIFMSSIYKNYMKNVRYGSTQYTVCLATACPVRLLIKKRLKLIEMETEITESLQLKLLKFLFSYSPISMIMHSA